MKPFVLVVYKFDSVPEHTVLVQQYQGKQTVSKNDLKYQDAASNRATD